MIRIAKHSDLPRIIEMGRKFFSITLMSQSADFDDESFYKTFDYLDGENGVCLVLEKNSEVVGMSAAMAYPFYLNLNHKTGQELFWWVEEEFRHGSDGLRLMRELETWARSVGCETFNMMSIGENLERIEKIYSKMGYQSTERTYMKRL